MNPTKHILHNATKQDTYNILCGSTHERQNSNLARTGHNFYAVKLNQHFKTWDSRYGQMPENYVELPKLPNYLSFSGVLSQHKFGQFQEFYPIAKQLSLPLISLEHTCAMPWWPQQQLDQLHNMRGDINVFITDWSLESWKWQDKGDTIVIKHCVDTDLFKPPLQEGIRLPRQNTILTVANDFIGRDYVLGYNLYKEVTQNLPVRPVGDTPGLSKPASSIEELVHIYQTSRIILNTAHLSPIPTNLLEGMACGCAAVSLDVCGVPEFITDGYDGFLCKNKKDMREKLELLLHDEKLATEMGLRARETITKKCSIDRFIKEWNTLFGKIL